jgi:hypothetical protein
MRYIYALAFGVALTITAAPAMAQLAAGGGSGSGMGSGIGGLTNKAPTPLPRTPDTAPAALPGAPLPQVATGPVLTKPDTGDPTTELFAAITKGDDSAAQSALGRGADLNAQNQFGETPLDLAIALNRTSIAFLLLQTRNELSAQGAGSEPIGAPWLLDQPSTPPTKEKAAYQPPLAPKPAPSPYAGQPANTGTPDPNAGFLGFAPKN